MISVEQKKSNGLPSSKQTQTFYEDQEQQVAEWITRCLLHQCCRRSLDEHKPSTAGVSIDMAPRFCGQSMLFVANCLKALLHLLRSQGRELGCFGMTHSRQAPIWNDLYAKSC